MTFVCPKRLPLYDDSIAGNASTVVRVHAEAAHESRLEDYSSYDAAEHGCAKFLRDVVNEVWYNDLKDANTFYTKVTALEIMAFLDLNSGGLHAVDMISLCTNMHQYYTQADGIPQYIIMLEDAQKKVQRAGMPIADIKLVMLASAAVLAAQHFPHKVDDLEGLPAAAHTWTAWKTAFFLAHLKHQRQILASGGGKSLGGAHSVTPDLPPAMDHLGLALDNLALAATNNTAVLQQLMATNLALTSTIATLTATNKKLVDTAAKTPSRRSTTPTASSKNSRSTKNPFPGNFCWTHGHHCSEQHTSATCTHKAPGHKDGATCSNTMGGSEKDKGWDKQRAWHGGMANAVYCKNNKLLKNSFYLCSIHCIC